MESNQSKAQNKESYGGIARQYGERYLFHCLLLVLQWLQLCYYYCYYYLYSFCGDDDAFSTYKI